jgi:hypothetical protein
LTYDLVQCDGFQKNGQLPKDGQVVLKHEAVDVILIFFKLKRGCEWF